MASSPKHTAVYLRVSSNRQDHASQLPDLKRWIDAHTGPVKWYRDTFTGRTMDRPGQAAVRARGKRWGGSTAGWYAKVTREQEQAIVEMTGRGERVTKIARITGLSKPTIYRVIRNQRSTHGPT